MFDNVKELFKKNIPEQEKADRFLRDGGAEEAIKNYGDELAYKSADTFSQTELTPEEEKTLETLRIGASNVIKSFGLKRSDDNKKGENILIVTDAGADPLMIRALHEAGRKIAGDDCRVVVAPKTEHAAQEFGAAIGERMKTADAVLLLTSLSRSHSKETVEVMHPHLDEETIDIIMKSPHLAEAFKNLRTYSSKNLADKIDGRKRPGAMFPSKARFISITNIKTEILTEGGALEDPEEMTARIDKFAEVMKGVEKVRITSENGTDLTVDIKVPSLMKETGVIDKPGQGSNFPSGEFAGSVDLAGTNGVYVADGAVGMVGRVDHPIKIFIENGVAARIEGGQSAKKIEEILQKAQKDFEEKNPQDKKTSAYKVAEFAFGMNSKAFRYEGGKRISPPTSLEGEKGLGTIHIALGKNSLFNMPKDDPDYNNIPIHIDFVAMETTVTGIKGDGSEIEIIKNGDVVCL